PADHSPRHDHREHSPILSESSFQNRILSIPTSQQTSLALAREFIKEATSASVVHGRQKSYREFQEFLSSRNLEENSIGLMAWIQEKILPKTKSAQSIQTRISHIDVSRRLLMLPPLQDDPIITEFKKAIKKKLPKTYSPSFLNIFLVLAAIESSPPMPPPTRISLSHEGTTFPISFLPSDPARIKRNRLRCIILTRTVALLRSVDCASIRRSSIKISQDLKSRRVLTFEYHGKAASIHSVEKESNYLEFLPSNPNLCPASAMLLLKDQVDALNTSHDFLFCSERKPHHKLKKERCSSLVRDFLRSLGIQDQKAHSIRKASNELLRLNGVPGSDRDARAGWKPKNSDNSPTQRLHYAYRMSSFNFAEVISRALEFNRSQDKN
ncbi:MAG: hypothetical protein OJI67_07690, partial [Prosthecobacter sp.]|nr:hypothetical protein [Prosthecobacter sp.]